MPNSIDTTPDATLIVLLTFTWGASSVARYCSDMQPLTIGGDTFASDPSILITMNQQQGGTQDVPVDVLMRLVPPMDAMTSQGSHAPVTCKIEEVNPLDFTSRRTLFSGLIRVSDKNPDNRSGLVKVHVSGWKFPLEVSANAFLATSECNNRFGDPICGKDLSTVQQNATITAISGATVHVTGLASPGGISGYWRKGYLSYDGLNIMIRANLTDDTHLTLLKEPPPDWLGKTVVATPGCRGIIDDCKRFGREESFTGFGIAIPSYNPYLETPA
jgi:hypothetical protein